MLKIALTVASVSICIFVALADIPQSDIGPNVDHSVSRSNIVKRDASPAKGKKQEKGNGKKKKENATGGKRSNGRKMKNGKKKRPQRKGGAKGSKKKCKSKNCRGKRRQKKIARKRNNTKSKCKGLNRKKCTGKCSWSNGKCKESKKGKKSNGKGTRKGKVKKCKSKECRQRRRELKKKKKKAAKKRNRNNDKNRQNSTLPSCFSKMFKYASKYKKAGNIFRQVKRTEGNKDKIEKKGKKKGDFNSTLMTLTSALGGNKTAPKCPGNSTASRQFADTLTLLDKCEADIDAACKFPNVTIKTDCKDAAQKFLNDTDACLKPSLSDADACSCFDALDLDATLAIIDGCSTKADNDAVLAEKNKCKSKFAECKKAEDSSVGLVNTCKEQLKCGGVATKEEGEKQLKALTPLSDALKQTGFADALDRLGLTSGDGADGKLPNATRNGMRLRFTRQTEDALCTGVLDKWKSFNSSGNAALPDGVNGDVNEAETTNTVNILNDLNQDDKLDEKLNSCQKETRQGVAVLVIVEIRFFVFWCGWWQITIVEVKITIISVAIGVPPPPPITEAPSPPAVSTSSPGRNLKKLVKKHLN